MRDYTQQLKIVNLKRFGVARKYSIISPPHTCLDTWQVQEQHGDVLELADRHDLGSCAERREGSIPSVPTKFFDPADRVSYGEIP